MIKEKKVHLYDSETGKIVCGISVTEGVETTESVSSVTCKRCERIITVRPWKTWGR